MNNETININKMIKHKNISININKNIKENTY